MHVFVNPRCGHGTGMRRWRRISERLHHRIGSFVEEEIRSPAELPARLLDAYERGEERFVAAGGDGTVHLLVNALMRLPQDPRLALGAVGLGSSNDFHKPFHRDAFLRGVPLRVDFALVSLCDVVRVELTISTGEKEIAFFAINASVGITAEANARFNKGGPLLRAARAVSVDTAVLGAAVSSLAWHVNQDFDLWIDDADKRRLSVTNLGIVKNAHFAGSLCYDTPVSRDDGEIAINVACGMSRVEKIGALYHLFRRRFAGRPKTACFRARTASLRASHPFALELDGEVKRVRAVRFEVLPQRLGMCP
jgi:diacylglycerol kinase (ATP)